MTQKIYTVSELNRETGLLLNEHFLSILVEGEISNLSIPASGHCYFTLKDAQSQVRCAMFRSQQRRAVKPENGKQVLVKAQVSLYEPRGDYQLIVEHLEEAGEGALRRAFDALTQKLSAEGLFAQEHKKALPVFPKTIGVITSPSGAAIRDILTVLRRRFAAVPVIIYPVAVQGDKAKYEICQALAAANRLKQCDVLILARGGGSLEDLWAFNEEVVARAIHDSEIPVISGIGHETDITIADFAADLRAATPSAAAEHATPDQQQWLDYLITTEARLNALLTKQLQLKTQKLDWLIGRIKQQHPQHKLQHYRQRLEDYQARLSISLQFKLRHEQQIIEAYNARLWQHSPVNEVKRQQQKLTFLKERLLSSVRSSLHSRSLTLGSLSQTLHAVSPLATLNRGYALATEEASGKIVRSAGQLNIGDKVITRVTEGSFSSRVEKIWEENPKIPG